MKTWIVAMRTLTRKPAYAVVAILTLAVGIGCNAAIFGLLDAMYFRPLPLREPGAIVQLKLSSPKSTLGMLSYREIQAIRENAPGLEDVVAIGARGLTLRQGSDVRLMIVHYVSGNYFAVLGIPMMQGRGLSPSDDASPATAPSVVINHQLWQEQLSGRQDVIGSTIQLNETLFTVIGVTAPGFQGLSRVTRTDVWITTDQARFVRGGLQDELESPYQRWFEVMARLSPQTTLAEAQSQLTTILGRWRSDNIEQYQQALLKAESFTAKDNEGAREGVVFLGLVGLVLMIACANVTNLSLAQSESRRREIGVRSALGASGFRLLRQSLAESIILALVGAGAGLILAVWLVALFPAFIPSGMVTYIIDVRFDARLFGFTALLTMLTAAIVGAIPAWRNSRTDVMSILKQENVGGSAPGRRIATRDVLVVTQVGISAIVIIVAGLLIHSFVQSRNINTGFDPDKNIATFYLSPVAGYDPPHMYRFFEEARNMAMSLPGVRRVSYAIRLPAQLNESGWAADFTVPGKTPPPGEPFFRVKYTMVGPGYFETMGTHILRGRSIGEQDSPDSPGIAVINQTMANRLWPEENPIGRTIMMGRQNSEPREIVGIAEDIKISGLYEEPQMYVYVPFAQNAQGFGLLLVEVEGKTENAIAPVKNGIAQIDKNMPILDVGTLSRHLDLVLFNETRDAWVAFGAGLIALFLGIIGIYSVVSLTASRRRKEIGIRLALGANRGEVLLLVLGRVFQMTAAGLLLGIAGGVSAGRLLQGQLHGLSPADPWSLAACVLILGLAAMLAGFVPCWRSSRADPSQVLRYE